jgi:hypothetical protein
LVQDVDVSGKSQELSQLRVFGMDTIVFIRILQVHDPPIRPVHMGADVLEGCAVVQHAHHVPSDVDADPSAKAHGIEFNAAVRFHVLDVTVGIARVAFLPPWSVGSAARHRRRRTVYI